MIRLIFFWVLSGAFFSSTFILNEVMSLAVSPPGPGISQRMNTALVRGS